METVWKKVEGYGGRYEVSNTGRVRSIARIVIDKNGHERPRSRTSLQQRIDSRYPYRSVDLYETNTKRKTVQVHKIVLETFVGKCPEGMQCRHLDGNPANNHVSNLCWGTVQQNAIDRKKHGKHAEKCEGEKHWCNKLTEETVLTIRKEYICGNGQFLAKKYNVSKSLIHAIITRKIWKHI